MFDKDNRLNADACAIDARNNFNDGCRDYVLTNLRPDGGSCCPTNGAARDPLLSHAVKHRNLVPWTGYGWNTCGVDDDSRLRVDAVVTHSRGRQQLAKRVFQAGPDLSRGTYAIQVEDGLRNGMDTTALNDCSRVTEKDYKRFVPGVCKVDVCNIVPSFWVHGGAPSRDIARSDAFLETVGYSRDTNGIWRKP